MIYCSFLFVDLEKFADLPSLDEAIQKVWMEIFETTAALLAANNDEDSLVCTSLFNDIF